MADGEGLADGFDAVVIGAGFGGMYAIYRFRQLGLNVKAFEAGAGVGGTWYWNRYPGARVDVESMVYSYSFSEELQQEWHWPEHFSPQAELERYANHVADQFGIREHIQFETRVIGGRFDKATNRWHIETDRGDHVVAQYLVSAAGGLDAANMPSFPGTPSFQGESYHTARWPGEGVDFKKKRVGVIGTGSTGIQVIPVVAQTAEHLFVFQRTANFSLPLRNRPLDPAYEKDYKEHYRERRLMAMGTESAAVLRGIVDRSVLDVTPEEREEILSQAWESSSGFGFLTCFKDIRTNLEANDLVAEFIRNKIHSTVEDPDVAELLCPNTHPIGTKRICIDSGYYETFNRENVTLVDVRTSPIEELTPTGLRTSAASYDLDVLIYATGFDAMTGSLTRLNLIGRQGRTLIDKWVAGPTSYLGMAVEGFPNLFIIHGPGSPAVLAQMIMGAEWQVNWIADTVEYVRKHDYECIEATPEAERWWTGQVEEAVEKTLFKMADSWYIGANIPGKPRVFMVYTGGFDTYTEKCSEVAANGYQGLVFS